MTQQELVNYVRNRTGLHPLDVRVGLNQVIHLNMRRPLSTQALADETVNYLKERWHIA